MEGGFWLGDTGKSHIVGEVYLFLLRTLQSQKLSAVPLSLETLNEDGKNPSQKVCIFLEFTIYF